MTALFRLLDEPQTARQLTCSRHNALVLTAVEAGKSKTKIPVDSLSSEELPPGLWVAVFLLCRLLSRSRRAAPPQPNHLLTLSWGLGSNTQKLEAWASRAQPGETGREMGVGKEFEIMDMASGAA